MHEKIELYKELTLEMISIMNKEGDYQDKIAELLDKRQVIIDSFTTSEDVIQFRVLYRDYDITSLDNELKELLTQELNKTKTDIIEQKKKRIANSAYSKVNREGLNLFSKQI